MVKFQQKVWELILKDKCDIKAIITALTQEGKTFGVYEAFGVHHTLEDGSSHTHICVALVKRPCWRSAKALDEYWTTGHGKLDKRQPIKQGKSVKKKMAIYHKYCLSQQKHEGQIIGEPVYHKYDPTEIVQIQAQDEEKLTRTAQCYKKYVEEGLSLYQQHEAADWNQKAFIMEKYETLTKMFSSYQRMQQENKPPEFPMASFTDTPTKRAVVSHDFKARLPGKKKQCLVLQGASNLGKTKLAKARFKKPLVVRHMDKLKQFDPLRHDGIIFDDMSFAHYPRECVLALMDMDDDADINVKNSMITIPAGHARVFCTNREMYSTQNGQYHKETSFLPAPLFTSCAQPMEIILPMEFGSQAEARQARQRGTSEISDEALTNRFTLIKVENKLYA